MEVTEALLTRIQEQDPQYKSYATVMAEQARTSAQAAERAIAAGNYLGPLHGVPIAVKDLCFTKGVATMGATKALMDHVPDFDCTVVQTSWGSRELAAMACLPWPNLWTISAP